MKIFHSLGISSSLKLDNSSHTIAITEKEEGNKAPNDCAIHIGFQIELRILGGH